METLIDENVEFTSSEPIYDFYVAGPFFTNTEVESMERLEKVLQDRHKKLFMPRFAGGQDSIAEDGGKAVFAKDVQAIRNSKAIIANLVDDDPGTLFEIGYAYALGKPVYLYNEGMEPGAKMNLMLVRSAKVILTGPADLEALLDSGEFEAVDVTIY
ncbi:nucleoside 2-deoxyribosyltransferase [Bifidobacterium magnum]|uniref:Nucleoside 2-deoxyribosyltransferase n=1 Tax=Bifidobacterium magnum TaxID=1692 RepID=A0A087BCG0_9BIFI|nr:nucleoside 2-deoxyribosyltransferase [Bifidobacterium magnum]KFI68710.1 Nucleoside 2-deoxyribosyltransferase [Bifidobacterium magnum]